MAVVNDKTMNGAVKDYRQPLDRQLRRVKEEVASHPGAGLLVGVIFGMLLGIWIKRR